MLWWKWFQTGSIARYNSGLKMTPTFSWCKIGGQARLEEICCNTFLWSQRRQTHNGCPARTTTSWIPLTLRHLNQMSNWSISLSRLSSVLTFQMYFALNFPLGWPRNFFKLNFFPPDLLTFQLILVEGRSCREINS